VAPRRTAAKTAITEAAEFDFEAFLADFERPEFTRSLFKKGKLVPVLAELSKELDDLETRVDRLEKATPEGEDSDRDITAVDPLSVLKRRLQEKTTEWNAVAEEFNASAIPFTFRVPDDKDDHDRIQALLEQDGFVQPDRPEPIEGEPAEDTAARKAAFEDAFNKWWDALTIRSMSVTCVSHTFTVAQWEALRDRVGLLSFSALMEAWSEAVQAAKPNGPFLLKPSPTPISEE
jgi:hypothetical protein